MQTEQASAPVVATEEKNSKAIPKKRSRKQATKQKKNL
jgi:hypothetical protein